MDSSSVQDLPKGLNVSLLELLEEQNLVHWSINSNESITSIVISFAIQGSHDFNLLGTEDLKFYHSQGLSMFWGLFIFLIKPVFYLLW